MRNIYTTYLLTLLTLILSACSTEDATTTSADIVEPPFDPTWEEPTPEEMEQMEEGSYATIKGFEPGDAVTRSTWIFDGQKLAFGWTNGDQLGIYPTAGTAKPLEGKTWQEINPDLLDPSIEANRHPEYSSNPSLCRTYNNVQSARFVIQNPSSDSQTAKMMATDSEFAWNTENRWSAYFPYNQGFTPLREQDPVYYTALPFDFSGQIQMGLPDMHAYYNGTSGQAAGSNNPTYKKSEADACIHLGQKDFLFSPEMTWEGEGTRINFQMRHVGAVARFFLLAPDEDLTLVSLKLICDKAIFYEQGTFNLASHTYNKDKTNKGLHLIGDDDVSLGAIQMTPTGTPTKDLTLDFASTKAVKIEKTTSANPISNYLVAYLMMYPITYNPATDGNLYAYVTARNSSDQEVHFVTPPLEGKTMRSGYYYQWLTTTKLQDGLYPIELTATLLPWQDIVGGNISTDLTK